MSTKRTTKKRMGRPPKGKAAKTIGVTVRVSAEELAVWRKRAKGEKMPLASRLLAPRRAELENKGK